MSIVIHTHVFDAKWGIGKSVIQTPFFYNSFEEAVEKVSEKEGELFLLEGDHSFGTKTKTYQDANGMAHRFFKLEEYKGGE